MRSAIAASSRTASRRSSNDTERPLHRGQSSAGAHLWIRVGCQPAERPRRLASRLHTDSAKLKVVLKNLINNAVKFTEQRRAAIAAQAHAEGVEFCVADTGIGISRDALPIIFDARGPRCPSCSSSFQSSRASSFPIAVIAAADDARPCAPCTRWQQPPRDSASRRWRRRLRLPVRPPRYLAPTLLYWAADTDQRANGEANVEQKRNRCSVGHYGAWRGGGVDTTQGRERS
ncbi:MAG: ATP-binding protein [bacterium]